MSDILWTYRDATAGEYDPDYLLDVLREENVRALGADEVYATAMHITINTNQAGTSQVDEAQRIRGMESMLQWLFQDFESVLDHREWDGEAKDIHIYSPAVEVGPRYHRVHAHFIVRVLTTRGLNVGKTADNLRSWLRQQTGRNFYVHVRLMNSRTENYALKQLQRRRRMRRRT